MDTKPRELYLLFRGFAVSARMPTLLRIVVHCCCNKFSRAHRPMLNETV